MILPSDSDLPDDGDTPDREPGEYSGWWKDPASGEGKDAEDDSVWDGAEENEDEDGEEEEFGPLTEFDESDPGQPTLQSIAGPGWQKDLYKDLVESLREISEIEDPEDEFNPPEPPDLYTFFGELAALRNELRHQGQRDQETLQQLSKSITSLGRSLPKAARGPAAAPAWSLESCLALISTCDFIPVSIDPAACAVAIGPLLKAAGMVRIPTEGCVFDPSTMTLAGHDPAGAVESGRVVREVASGYLRDGSLLRPAAVIVRP